MRPVGVGLVFTRALFECGLDEHEAVSVIEIEPQTLWQLTSAGGRHGYALNTDVCTRLALNPKPKLFHSVGLPVGSSRPLEAAQIDLLRTMGAMLRPEWISEHLSFNAYFDGTAWPSAGVFLPPHQSEASVTVAAEKIRALGESLDLPVAFETGVNYLREQPGELPDGAFYAGVAKTADSGILVDLHNLWTNEVNGRTPVADVLEALPLDRVWELHLAGGMPFGTHWLDAHSDTIPPPVLELAEQWIGRLPNLGALVFEVLDEHVARIGLDGILRQLELMHELWTLRSHDTEIRVGRPRTARTPVDGIQLAAVRAWERTLGSLVTGHEPDGELASRLREDPGLPVFRQLVADARSGFISEGLHYTTSLLLGTLGPARVRELLDEFMRSCPPELFVSAESDHFASFLRGRAIEVPYLDEVLGFEHALIRAALYDEEGTVQFAHDPTALFESLDRGVVPADAVLQGSAIRIRPG